MGLSFGGPMVGSEEAVPCAQMAQGRAGLRPVEASVRGEPLSVRWGMLARAVDQEGRDLGGGADRDAE